MALCRFLLWLAIVSCLAFSNLPALAQEFSADLVHSRPAGALPGKVMVKGNKIRFETTNGEHGSVVILDVTQQTGFMLIPDSKMYTTLQPARTAVAIPVFHPVSPEDACGAWEKYVNKPGSCTKIGEETVNGRAAVRYRGVARGGDPGSAWVDRKLNFVVKWDGLAGAAELQNIREGPQSTELFEVPKDYEKMDIGTQKTEAGAKPPKGKPVPPKPQKP